MNIYRKIGKISIMGNYALKDNAVNGQTIKTKQLTEELIRRFGDVQTIDTSANKLGLVLSIPFLCMKALIKSKNVVILPAENGLRLISPLLVMENFIFKRALHYVVIGGWLPEFLKDYGYLLKCLRRFTGVYVETKMMKEALENLGLTNVYILPNFKNLRVLKNSEIKYMDSTPHRLCTFSRVSKEKGIEDAVNAVKAINDLYGKIVFELDIYGQVDENQKRWFASILDKFPPYIRYCGIVPYDLSTEILKNYYALLFPTYYDGEGFAGTLIDAMSAGVPVIASDWKYNAEIIADNFTGLIVPSKDVNSLINALDWIYTNQKEWNLYKKNCVIEAEKYTPEKAVVQLIEQLLQNC